MNAHTKIASVAVEVSVTNPSPYARGGVVQVPWSELVAVAPNLPPSVEVVYNGRSVPAQTDDLEKDPSSRVLTFSLDAVPPGDEHYRSSTVRVVVRQATTPTPHPIRQVADDTRNGVHLAGSVLDVWLSLVPRPWNDHRSWFAGAASTVQVHTKEFLDVNAGFIWVGHDPEKRAMQIDRLRIWRPPWDHHEPTYYDCSMHDRRFELVHFGSGPVRAWATIRSDPFTFDFRDLTENGRREYNCRLYRSISLYSDADHLIEELYVKAEPKGFDGPTRLAFAVRYFMSAHFGLEPQIRRVPRIPDWFAIGSDMPPFPGYGFATDAHASTCVNPPAHYPRGEEDAHKGFEWETAAAPKIRSLHLFRIGTRPADIADITGKAWYLHILKPLRAHVVGEWGGRVS